MSKPFPATPYAIERPSLIPAPRYYDAGFYALEKERLWPRVWQMACRLEEIPKPGDFVVYDILDQSLIVTRVDDRTVKAYHNACRHRGVQLVKDRGHCPGVFTCPFHGWQFGIDGKCKTVYSTHLFERELLRPDDLRLRECRLEVWGGCAFINFDDEAPPLRASIEPFATMHDAWHVESLRT
jgi:glycine betaine catabolism A